jgi:hypothetical protein
MSEASESDAITFQPVYPSGVRDLMHAWIGAKKEEEEAKRLSPKNKTRNSKFCPNDECEIPDIPDIPDPIFGGSHNPVAGVYIIWDCKYY